MKLLKCLYQDADSNIWEIQKESLSKKKGEYTYWIAECKSLNKCFRANLKRDILKQIKTIKTKTNGTSNQL